MRVKNIPQAMACNLPIREGKDECPRQEIPPRLVCLSSMRDALFRMLCRNAI